MAFGVEQMTLQPNSAFKKIVKAAQKKILAAYCGECPSHLT